MVKAKDFWNYLCLNMNYRFFSGVPDYGFKNLFKYMNSDIMHYIPAINEQAAISLSSGVNISGINSGVIIPINKINYLNLNLNFKMKIPLIILTTGINKPEFDGKLKVIELEDNYENKLYDLNNYIETNSIPIVLFFKEGLLT